MNKTTEGQFLNYVESLFNSKHQQNQQMTSTTMIRELQGSREEIEFILYQAAKDFNFSVERDAIRYYLNSGNYNLSDYFNELHRRLNTKRNLLKLNFFYFLVCLLVILGIYNLLQVNVLTTVLCCSIGSSIFVFITGSKKT
ncbi:hypothetical protein [Paenibacillus sp. N3.4]|uniref:hypothetical protein n=1 Tax=Paenibacillus sp. N3.4 TaxID=2603222 RepID=UPI0011C849AE|nr:hypothetical protein [Paenibacillus sp. N3.4]TXK70258.1 hypothetical protein FU659_33615 [Paenibacillus sp. N3.4]